MYKSIMITFKKYDNKPNLLLTDTDSLMDEVKADHVYEDLMINKCFILVIFRLSQNTMMIKQISHWRYES